jgi:hypothetical protein
MLKDAAQLHHVAQVEGVAGVVLGNDQQVAGFRADLLDGGLCGLHRQRQHFGRQVVPAAGKQVGVHRRELEAGIADVDRTVERRCVLHPLQAKPAFDGRHGIEDALFELVDGTGQRGNEMGNHTALFLEMVVRILGLGAGKAPFKPR